MAGRICPKSLRVRGRGRVRGCSSGGGGAGGLAPRSGAATGAMLTAPPAPPSSFFPSPPSSLSGPRLALGWPSLPSAVGPLAPSSAGKSSAVTNEISVARLALPLALSWPNFVNFAIAPRTTFRPTPTSRPRASCPITQPPRGTSMPCQVAAPRFHRARRRSSRATARSAGVRLNLHDSAIARGSATNPPEAALMTEPRRRADPSRRAGRRARSATAPAAGRRPSAPLRGGRGGAHPRGLTPKSRLRPRRGGAKSRVKSRAGGAGRPVGAARSLRRLVGRRRAPEPYRTRSVEPGAERERVPSRGPERPSAERAVARAAAAYDGGSLAPSRDSVGRLGGCRAPRVADSRSRERDRARYPVRALRCPGPPAQTPPREP